MANLKGGKFDKFLVLKSEYIDSPQAQHQAELLCEYADCKRTIKTGKIDKPTYLVINTDEPYADEVIEIMKRNGHWG